MIQLSDKPVIVQGNTLMEQEEAAARGIDCAAARQNTLAWNILAAHNTAAGDDPTLRLRFDALASHDITYVAGLLQLGQAKPLFILPLCLAVAVYEGEFAGALFGAVSGLLWDYTAGRTVGMLALELLLLCFALSVLVQVYLQGSTWNFALISTGTALVVLSLDWLFFYYMPGYSWALSRWLTFVLPSAMMTLVPSLVLFSLVRHIYSAFKIDNGVV